MLFEHSCLDVSANTVLADGAAIVIKEATGIAEKSAPLNPIVLPNLKREKSATDKFSAAVIKKLPEALKGAAETLDGRIKTVFSMTLLITAKQLDRRTTNAFM
ncbi:hypothetical protein CTA1_7947 [Colletotrichum tanaceti]|uniref:Uncharacterized protein n=1 Tax=Colletotrichum tanaceti TaxID=1306861 RepID=A0A4U6XN30_9PEZI|nr:hypothetical protein CTA1_7947 [Colletotrichum tanaceti]